jgi:hypothetical protein
MRAPILIAAAAFLFPACACSQADAGAAAADGAAIHHLLEQYAQAVNWDVRPERERSAKERVGGDSPRKMIADCEKWSTAPRTRKRS